MNKQSTETFQNRETILYYTTVVDTCHYTFTKPIDYTTQRVIPVVNYELWVTIMCQYVFISYKKYIILVGHVGSKAGCACVSIGEYMG